MSISNCPVLSIHAPFSYINQLTAIHYEAVARHYKLLVQPCSNLNRWWFLYRIMLWNIWFILPQHASLRFWDFNALLPPLLALITISCTYIHNYNAGYRNTDFCVCTLFFVCNSSIFACVRARSFNNI
jgi:hypothetical protein